MGTRSPSPPPGGSTSSSRPTSSTAPPARSPAPCWPGRPEGRREGPAPSRPGSGAAGRGGPGAAAGGPGRDRRGGGGRAGRGRGGRGARGGAAAVGRQGRRRRSLGGAEGHRRPHRPAQGRRRPAVHRRPGTGPCPDGRRAGPPGAGAAGGAGQPAHARRRRGRVVAGRTARRAGGRAGAGRRPGVPPHHRRGGGGGAAGRRVGAAAGPRRVAVARAAPALGRRQAARGLRLPGRRRPRAGGDRGRQLGPGRVGGQAGHPAGVPVRRGRRRRLGPGRRPRPGAAGRAGAGRPVPAAAPDGPLRPAHQGPAAVAARRRLPPRARLRGGGAAVPDRAARGRPARPGDRDRRAGAGWAPGRGPDRRRPDRARGGAAGPGRPGAGPGRADPRAPARLVQPPAHRRPGLDGRRRHGHLRAPPAAPGGDRQRRRVRGRAQPRRRLAAAGRGELAVRPRRRPLGAGQLPRPRPSGHLEPGARPMSTLRLALRGLLARAGLSAALLAVTTFAVGVGVAGAIYLRAAGESLLTQNLRSASSYTAGLHVDQVVADGRELRGLTQSVAAAGPAVPALAPPVTGLETRTPVPVLATGGRGGPGDRQGGPPVGRPGAAYLASRDGLCAHLALEEGRCPAARPLALPAEAAVSRRAADWFGLGLGDRFRAKGFGAGAAVRDLVVTAVYTPTPSDAYWFGAQPAYFPPPPLGNELPPMDAVFLAGADLLPALDNGTLDIRARYDHFIQPERMRLTDTAAVPAALARAAEVLRINNPNAVVLTGLAGLVAKAEADSQFEAGIPVVVTPAAVAVALAATVVALAAASLASLGAVRRRILDQWRRGRSDRVGRRAVVLDVVLLLVAAAALANLRASGTRQASGGYDVLATVAPGLAVLAAALVAGRSLPLVAGWLVRLTGRSAGVATWVGSRQGARRGGP